jgi:hypothetical protein
MSVMRGVICGLKSDVGSCLLEQPAPHLECERGARGSLRALRDLGAQLVLLGGDLGAEVL